MRDLCDEYGEESVYRVGLSTLGYPPVMVTSGEELTRLRAAMVAAREVYERSGAA